MEDKTTNVDTLIPLAIIYDAIFQKFLGGNKMFGLNNEMAPQKLAEEMMAGAVRGILDYFEYKMDSLERNVKGKGIEIEKLMEEIEKLKEQLKEYELKKAK